MNAAILIMAVLLPVLMAVAFLLGRHLHRHRESREDLSPVSRQHIDLFQGSQLSEAAVESTKVRFRELLERGELDAVEASLRPGTHYRSEEHTSELQSHLNLVCRLLLEK